MLLLSYQFLYERGGKREQEKMEFPLHSTHSQEKNKSHFIQFHALFLAYSVPSQSTVSSTSDRN